MNSSLRECVSQAGFIRPQGKASIGQDSGRMNSTAS